MNKIYIAIGIALMFYSCKQTTQQESIGKYEYHTNGNPFLPMWEHMPDGEPHVFSDPDNPGKTRLYVIGSHDTMMKNYCGVDVHMWSASTEDLTSWRDEGAIYTFKTNQGDWDGMFAPDMVEVTKKDGTHEYYLYPNTKGGNREPVVAKSKRPDGPFEPINLDTDGGLAEGSIFGFDPAVLVVPVTDPSDSDYEIGFKAYGYWGFKHSYAAELDQNTMYSVHPGTEIIDPFIPAEFDMWPRPDDKEFVNPKTYSSIYPEEDPSDFNFFEASSIRQVGNKFVFIYSGFSGKEYGMRQSNSTLRYAYSDSPLGPWKNGGVLVDTRAPMVCEHGDSLIMTNGNHNTHGSIEKIGEQWYVFYHRPPRGFGFARQAMVAPINVKCDDKTVSEGGKVVITGYDPYSSNHRCVAVTTKNWEYTGAEVTSEGFYIYGLDPYRYYSAGIASFLSDVNMQQDNWDVWSDHAPITSVKSGAIIGYKFFGFGGLDKDCCGIKAFAGAKKGNETKLNIWVNPKHSHPSTIHIWIHAPWNNGIWQGKEIASVEVPVAIRGGIQKLTVDVADAIEGLAGKHAIYLVAEGGDGDLFDLEAIAFSKKGVDFEYQETPEVILEINGRKLKIPALPMEATRLNGFTECNHYDVIAPESANLAQLTAKSSSKEVEIRISHKTEKTIVTCTYKGKNKYFEIHK